ncbi:MAG: chromosome segregation protein SMC [Gemmatimonadales bacterium]|jgi:chromosome segregation protein|nr:MAG: chromosome segregation protein SMC [Gemmatimonadales bacterium]
MKLKSLRVHGFKSFADSTEVKFHDGVTAIVGPNGCGKSNISDAIRWVLGEQRPTAIRGSKMEEAIFQGSVQRRPVNRGSVTMVVGNEDGSLPVPFEEVEIGRTVYRDGGSDYAINRSGVRLKDVVELTRDTGLGAGANVIENRMIDAILSDRADERRALFEEAAGIGKYKDRRKAALRRLERAEMDLQRLEDVIAEVQTKVRSLARQKGKAERHMKLRARRLSVEVAVVGHQMENLHARLAEVERALEGGTQEGEGRLAEVRSAETEFESLRIRQVDAQRARSQSAGQLDEIRTELVRWERDLAVAEERAAYARRRLSQIDDERDEARERAEFVDQEAGTLREDAEAIRGELAGVTAELQERTAAADAVRTRLQAARQSLEEVEIREREIARRSAQLEGDAESAEAQAAELGRRLQRLQVELAEASDAATDLAEQGDLFTGRLDVLQGELAQAEEAFRGVQREVGTAREILDQARREELDRADRAQTLQARHAALESVEREREGIEPVVQAILEADLPGVYGPLVDYLNAPEELARAVEAYLGPQTRGLVVQDAAAVRRVRAWFADNWTGGGGIILLPLDAVPRPEGGGSLLEVVQPSGPGEPWVRALLSGVSLVEDEELLDGEGTRVSRSGATRDSSGVIRIGNPTGATGLLERKERVKRLGEDAERAGADAAAARERREAAQAALQRSEERLEEARATFRAAEDTYRGAAAEVAEASERKDRMDRHRDEVARQVEGTRVNQSRASERARQALEDREALRSEEAGLGETRTRARETLEVVQEEWEAARSEQSRLEVKETRLQGELTRLTERLSSLEQTGTSARDRLEALDREEQQLRDEHDQVTRLQSEGAEATQALFLRRDEAQADLALKDQALAEVAESLNDAERRAKAARQAEREATDHRHRLELEKQELQGRLDRIRDRLEGEWGKPLETLLEQAEPLGEEDAGRSPEELTRELRQIVVDLDRIGPVNMLAMEEHKEESERLQFLEEQHSDLVGARNDLKAAIRQINETATALFHDTFQLIRENFKQVHRRLFEGGEADIWLADEDDPLESPVEIHASPQGKKTQRIDLLSGGERALTALSLLFAIYLVKPSPFCVLDEVDAPLDENNIGRFIRLLHDFKHQTQFVVITHNPRTIEAADWIYGVTMEEPGVSTIVGVRLEDALEQARGAA